MTNHKPAGELNRRDATLFALALSGAGSAALSQVFAQDTNEDANLVAEMEAELKKQEEIWNSQDYQRIRELWDRDDPEPFYVAAELEETIIGWPALDNYLAPPKSGLAAFRWGFSNVKARWLGSEFALALCDHWFEFQIVGKNQRPKSGFDRLLLIYKKKPEGWKLILYANCPHSVETHVRALVERNVKPDFAEFREEAFKKRAALESER
jgi:hypothetical protein